MDKQFRCKKYSKNSLPNRHRGSRLRRSLFRGKKVRREKSKQKRRLLYNFIRDQRFQREGNRRNRNARYEFFYIEDGYSEGLCACQGYDENNRAICPHGGLVNIMNPTPVTTYFPDNKYFRFPRC